MSIKMNSDNTAVVDQDYDWLKITKETPRGAKLQLLTRFGVAVYGQLSAANLDDFTAWAPCPRKPDWLRALEAQPATARSR